MTENLPDENPYPLLSRIDSPQDLKQMSFEELTGLASEIRQVIAETCSRNGGHFAPSLGVVELTIALHLVYNTPVDKLVWDVGHQAYPHKLLTGRYPEFHTLRQMGGISGFPRRDESPYDAFGVGHASTALSAALGMALARDTRGGDYRVVAIIGDGAITGGLFYEALNNLGWKQPNMLVILNDNEMSISPNIGAMSRYFNQLITTPFYMRSKETAEDFIKRLPSLGRRVLDFSHRVERSIKDLIIHEDTVVEKMGIRYLGPVDGHDLAGMIDCLHRVRDLGGPIFLHVKTVKGKGYPYSESDPERWHSGAGFSVDTGEKMEAGGDPGDGSVPPPTYTEVFSRTLVDLAEKDEKIVAITAAMPAGTGLQRFADRFPARFHDVGIAEAHAVCCGAGMAAEGLRPVVALYSSFLQRAFDQVIHDVALQQLPLTLAIDRAGIVGDDGPTHHGVFDLSYLRMIPGMVVAAPRNEEELRRIMVTAACYRKGPFAYRYPRGRGLGVERSEEPEPVEIGRGEVLVAAGPRGDSGPGARRVAFLTVGPIASNALAAVDLLADDAVEATVADMRFVKPLDVALIRRLAGENDLLVTVEENVRAGGFGAGVAEFLIQEGIATPLEIIALPDEWIEHGPIPALRERHGLDAKSIAQAVRKSLGGREEAAAEPKSHAAAK